MTNKISTKDWENLPIEKWNVSTIHAYLIDETERKFNAEYKPGGRGSLSQRWAAEKGMIKRELTKKGPEVVRKFIEICWTHYRSSDPKKYPYATFGFMLGFMDRYWNEAEQEVTKESERADVAERSDSTTIDEEWF